MNYRVEVLLKDRALPPMVAVREPEISPIGHLQVMLKDGYLVYAPGYWLSYGVKEHKDG
ncbi:hypothetical protein J4T96_gp059 [Mycobacterium phage Finemlucis]|uniref:Uncharacterized protein n=1 Tax=Mycobacterium phage Finemlucis TaxID=2015844 RepID=A0A291I9V5_9CAUD|nr:hypothetical protein J4T96_gp059 [Mycobacterium phage Finemlucis]ALY07380.1 hypothetical protein SEA_MKALIMITINIS3_60 [Mycobacterium phage MkaliMitinis3]AOT22918.1 hypothetical protein SEA_ZAKAI_60 [Mycobacterium phage Zakai]ATG86470.1 hypothetical protein SEA_FINEMLUCIS_59 [Mycobacterium phage Finemlucis]UJQ87067.1 hypothetical protein SEA_VETRIX_59 [Mycobacterium phage Vetrix]